MPWLKDRFIMSLKGFENFFLNNFKILFGILFGPHALFVFIEVINSSMSSGRVGERKLCYCFLGWGRRNVFLTWQYFCYFFSNICKKKLLKWLEISLVLVIIWSSIRRLEIDLSDFLFMFMFRQLDHPFNGLPYQCKIFLLSSKHCL